MKKIPEKEGRNIRLSQFFGDNPSFQPIYLYLYPLLQNKILSPLDYTLFSVIIHHGYYTLWGKTDFPLSNTQMRKLSGMSEKAVRKSLITLEGIGFIRVSPAQNGLKNWIYLEIEKLKDYTITSVESAEDLRKNDVGTSVESAEDLRKNDVGTSVESADHLLERVFKDLSLYEKRFAESTKREIFKSEMKSLLRDGVKCEEIIAFLETQVPDFGKINSFRAVILGRKSELSQVLFDYQKIQAEKILELKRYEEIRTNQTRIDQEKLLGESEADLSGPLFKSLLNQITEVQQ